MAVMRIISRLIHRRPAPSSSLQWFYITTSAAQPPTLNSLFSEVVNKSSESDIADILRKWVDEGKQVKKLDIVNLSRYFRNRKNFRAAIQLYDWMESSLLKINNADQAKHIDLLCTAEGLASAEKYFNNLQESEKTYKTYGALLSCYCKERVYEKALEIFEKVKVLNYATTLNYNNVLALLNDTGQPEKVPSLVQEMEENDIAPDIYTYNLLINSYASLKDFDAMDGVLDKMEISNLKPDSFTYGNLATMFCNSGLHEEAYAVLELMEQIITRDDKSAIEGYRTRMKLYSTMNDLSGVNRAWEALKLASPTPSNVSYLFMLLALSKLGDKENLEKIFEEWEEGCSLYDFRLPNVLLEYYLNHNMIEEATRLYKRMESKGYEPNLRALTSFMNLCIKHHQRDLALEYLEMGLNKTKSRTNEWFPSKETVALFAVYFEENDDTDGAVKFKEIMKKHGRLDSDS